MTDPITTSLSADIHKIVSDAGTDVEGAVSKIMGLLIPPSSPPVAGSFSAAAAASVIAGKAWFSFLGPMALPVMIGLGAMFLYDNFAWVAALVSKL